MKLKDKIPVKGAKFDFQAVETGAEFQSYCELLDGSYRTVLESAFAALNSGIIGFGAKTTRGFGKVSLTVKKRVFADVESWLDFRMFEESEWADAEPVSLSGCRWEKIEFRIGLKSLGGLSVREYSTDIGMPDYKTLTLKTAEGFTPVIPGTSWAGAFRERCADILTEAEINSFFGVVDEKTADNHKSQIVFFESVLSGGTPKDITRNSIDRFSCATKNGALYTERTYFNGETALEMLVPGEKTLLSAIGVCLADLDNGFLTVGGLSAVGRGLFAITEITADGRPLTEYITGDPVDIRGFVKEAIKRD